jgi:hypothetical protein
VDVHQAAAGLVFDRQLDRGENGRAGSFGVRVPQRVQAGKGVVVRDGDRRESGRGVRRHNFGGRQLSIAEDGVQVQIRPPVGRLSQWWPIV